MSVSAGVSDAAIAIREKLRGKIGQTKVKRYWPGKAPEWADEREEEDDEEEELEAQRLENQTQQAREGLERARIGHEDQRLRRLAESRRDRDEAVARHREIRAAEIVSAEDEEREREQKQAEEASEEEDEDEIEARRRRIRERRLQEQQEEELPVEEDEEEEEESEYETDSEEEDGGHTLIKPVFVPKSERETVVEREKLEEEDRLLEEAAKRRLEERKQETKQMVVEEIRKEEERERNVGQQGEEGRGAEFVDTDDEKDEAEEFELWRGREIGRMKREKEEKEAIIKEREELDRVRNMSEEERREWERRNPRQQPGTANKKKWKFMQKYYHKGAFFQESPDDRGGTGGGDTIYTRDYSDPTGEDKMDRTVLPKVMQVKNFGRSGQTKWTHLVEEDTTQWDNPWTYNDPLRARYNNKMAGMSQTFAKPKGSKKLKDWK